MSSLCFCLSWKVFVTPAFLKDGFAGCGILSGQVYSFSTWNVSSHSPRACIISAKKSSDNFMGASCDLYVMLLSRVSLCLLTAWLQCVLAWASLGSSYLESFELPQFGCTFLFSDLGNFDNYFFSLCLFLSLLFLRLPLCMYWSSCWCPFCPFGISIFLYSFFALTL